MNRDPQVDRLQDLLDGLANESLTREQHAELQAALRDHPEAQERYFALIDLQIGLRKLASVEEQALLTVGDKAAGKSARFTRSRLVVIASLAALVLVTVSLSLFFRGRGADEIAVADPVRLKQSAGAEFFGHAVPPVEGVLEYGREYALTSGMVELRFPNGAEVIIEAPSVIEIAARDRLAVKVGACSVHAPPGAEGFRVETPQAEVVDLGTRFSVNVNEVGETDVQVIEGAADVRSRIDQVAAEPLRLTNGESRRFSDKAERAPQQLPFDADRYRRGLPDRVVSYEARADRDGHIDELLSVTVQRGGRSFTYRAGDLIGVEVTHFHAGTNNHNIAVAAGDVASRSGVLESDALLNTGLINPGGSESPPTVSPDSYTPGMAVRFQRPIVNGPGPDVLFFDLQTVVDPPDGDAFHVSPLKFAPGLRSHSVRKYDISMLSPEARSLVAFELRFFAQPPRTLDELLNKPAGGRLPPLRFRALAVAIDLSDLGYAERAEVNGLFFQDALDDDHQVDPVLIAGMPFEPTKDAAP